MVLKALLLVACMGSLFGALVTTSQVGLVMENARRRGLQIPGYSGRYGSLALVLSQDHTLVGDAELSRWVAASRWAMGVALVAFVGTMLAN